MKQLQDLMLDQQNFSGRLEVLLELSLSLPACRMRVKSCGEAFQGELVGIWRA